MNPNDLFSEPTLYLLKSSPLFPIPMCSVIKQREISIQIIFHLVAFVFIKMCQPFIHGYGPVIHSGRATTGLSALVIVFIPALVSHTAETVLRLVSGMRCCPEMFLCSSVSIWRTTYSWKVFANTIMHASVLFSLTHRRLFLQPGALRFTFCLFVQMLKHF